MIPAPSCPVRGCGLPLGRRDRLWACARSHSFDVARSGHLTLLQPQDRRSAEPGDSAEQVAARSRILELGAADELVRVLAGVLGERAGGAAGPLRVLDVGCGDGFVLARLAEELPLAPCGVDLSREAAAIAARRLGDRGLVVVANADRGLPWPDASFDAALSVTARRPAAELRRVLAPGGLLLVAVPAADDLIELREAVLGRGDPASRAEAVVAELARDFRLARRLQARDRRLFGGAAQRDLLASTYRAGRRSREEAAAALPEREVTLAHDVLVFEPVAGPPTEGDSA